MIENREYFFIFIIWVLLFAVYYFVIFTNLIGIHEALIISFVLTSFFKSIYDIKYKTGNQSMYIYSDKTNQKLRYLVFSVTLLFVLVYHSILLTNYPL